MCVWCSTCSMTGWPRRKKPLLKVDGLFGPKTKGATVDFQRKHLNMQDGIIDINGPTITKLFERHLNNLVSMLVPLGSMTGIDSSPAAHVFADPVTKPILDGYIAALRKGA